MIALIGKDSDYAVKVFEYIVGHSDQYSAEAVQEAQEHLRTLKPAPASEEPPV